MRAPVWVSAVGTCTRGRVVVRVRVSPNASRALARPCRMPWPRRPSVGHASPPPRPRGGARDGRPGAPAAGHGLRSRSDARVTVAPSSAGDDGRRRRREVRAARRRADVVEGVGHDARRSVGGATSARIWAMTCSTVMPANGRLGGDEQAVVEHRLREQLDVVGHHVVAALADRPGLRAAHERQAATHRQPEPDADVPPGLLGEARDVVEDRVVDVHLVGELGHVGDDPRGDHRLQAPWCGRGSWRRAAPAPWRRGRGSRARSSSGSGRAGPRAAGRCRPARWGSGWR